MGMESEDRWGGKVVLSVVEEQVAREIRRMRIEWDAAYEEWERRGAWLHEFVNPLHGAEVKRTGAQASPPSGDTVSSSSSSAASPWPRGTTPQ